MIEGIENLKGSPPMRESVSAVFTTSDEVYFIKRQNYLAVFPGYHATPGGKVDSTDKADSLTHSLWPKHINPQILHALVREVKEELNYDLHGAIERGEIASIHDIGVAITPEFNPYRFKNYYFKIKLKTKKIFAFDSAEVEYAEWSTPQALLDRYHKGEILAVPPAITLLKKFVEDHTFDTPIIMTLPHDPETEVPMIESISGVRQFLPLSNTFPPANRTNSFIIGDVGSTKYLIDPSPANETELKKFLKSVDKVGFDRILITHHHPDHYEFSRDIALKYNVPMEMSEYTFKRIGAEYFKGITVNFRKEGEVLTQSLGHDVLIYEVPGHDEGQLALAPKTLSWFLAGDLIQTIGTVVIGDEEGDMKKYFATLKRIIKMNPKCIIPSHGIIVGGVNKLIETLEHRQKREDQIKGLMQEGKNNDEILDVVYLGLKPELRPYALKTILAHQKKILDEN
jgi:ribonuclease/clavin/mitogillin